MNTQEFKRKLTAVFSADVAGYSRLMGEDEAATVKTLEAYKQIMSSLIKQHRGRVVDSPGDNLLAEFASVVDAVQCGVAVQKEIQARNAELPENRKMQFRIGINLGDVIEEGGRIYGDGVNIAARLESLAEPGGICLSKTAFDQIETKLPLGYRYIGEQTVKNITKAVVAYKVLMEPRIIVEAGQEQKKGIPFWRHKAVLAGAVPVLLMVIAVAVWNFHWRAAKIEPAYKEKQGFPLGETPAKAGKVEIPAPVSENQKRTEMATPEKPDASATVSLGISPWGEVYIDGHKKGLSPPLNRLQVTPGKHTIEIRNTTYPPHQQTVNLKQGEQIKIKHKFR